MIRVVIVEDETLVRIGVKMCIGRYDPQLTVVKDFSCAEDALEYFEHNTADVLVTDIRLNGMSGLDMIRTLQKKHHNMVLIILSCYEDFSYAKEAIELGVNSYLLKHEISEDEIPKQIMEQYQKKKYTMSNDTMGYMEKVADTEENTMGEFFQVAVLELRKKGEHKNTSIEEINYEILTEILQNHLDDSELGDCFLHHNREICILFRFRSKEEMLQADEKIQYFWHEASASVQNYFNRNAYMIVSETYDDLKKTKENYSLVLEKADRCFYYENSTCIKLEDDKKRMIGEIPQLRLLKNDIFTEAWCREMQYEIGLFIKRCCTEGISAKNVKYSIMRLLNEMELYLEQNYKDIILTEIFGDKEYIGYQEVEDFDSADQLEKELKKTLEMVCNHMQNLKEDIYMIERYILDNYAKQITLTDMAEKFHMSSVYFCQYFKKKKGITYLQFLNQIRIEKAKELLEKREYTLEQVAEMVGINNSNYFGRLFKKVTGMTTGEYLKWKS